MKLMSPYSKTVYSRNAEIYKLMAHPARLEILNTLSQNDAHLEDLTDLLGISKANVSQHLALLRHAGLVTVRREGQQAIYRITHPGIVSTCQVLNELSQIRGIAQLSH